MEYEWSVVARDSLKWTILLILMSLNSDQIRNDTDEFYWSDRASRLKCQYRWLQAILHLAQSVGIIASKDVFRTAGIFAFTDYYQDHFHLPDNCILMLTNRRILMLLVSYYGLNGIGWDILWKAHILFGGSNVSWTRKMNLVPWGMLVSKEAQIFKNSPSKNQSYLRARNPLAPQ